MSEAKQEILTFLAEYNLSVQWLADKLNMNYYKIYYVLHHQEAKLDLDLYTKIMSVLNKYSDTKEVNKFVLIEKLISLEQSLKEIKEQLK